MGSLPSGDRNLLPALAVVVAFLLSGLGAWYLWRDDGRTPPRSTRIEDPAPPAPRNVQPLQPKPPAPEPKPEPQPEPEQQDPPHVSLPLMTPFRALVREADECIYLRNIRAGEAVELTRLWSAVSTLEQLKSRFAPYARLLWEGQALRDDHRVFNADVADRFERPDVATAAYRVETSARVALWLRGDAKLPEHELEPPKNVAVPLTRRLQEVVSLETVETWLTAMEGEYGVTDYGTKSPPMDIVIYGDRREYLDFSKRRLLLEVPTWSAGYFSSKWDVVCMPLLEETCLAEVIRHEMFHALQSHRAPLSLLVPWFSEGTAEWIDKAPQKGALQSLPAFSESAWGHLAALLDAGLQFNLREFLALGLEEFYANPQSNYLLAYCWIDFVRGDKDLRSLYFEYWKLMCGGVLPAEAFARTFGTLDLEGVEARFLSLARRSARQPRPPRFTYDATPGVVEGVSMPGSIGGKRDKKSISGEISQGWFDVLGKLEEAGFDTGRAGFLMGTYDTLVVAADGSGSMQNRIEDPKFDWDKYARWLFSLRFAGTISLSRSSPSGTDNEAVPPALLMVLVESVLLGTEEEFVKVTGIGLGDELVATIKQGYKNTLLSPLYLSRCSKRELVMYTAESVAWYWGTRQDESRVVLITFHAETYAEVVDSRKVRFTDHNSSPLSYLFNNARKHVLKPSKNITADTDWWLALQEVINFSSDRKFGRVACLFFTDGPNSIGTFGTWPGEVTPDYLARQTNLAEEFAYAWELAGLGHVENPSVLQCFALPGAEGLGLDAMAEHCPEARVDNWYPRFRKD